MRQVFRSRLSLTFAVAMLALGFLGAGAAIESGPEPSIAAASDPNSEPPRLLPLEEPEARVFAQRLASRAILDAHANRTHQPEVPWEPAVLRPPARYARGRQSVRVVRTPLPEAVRLYRQTLPTRVTPLPSFRAPILGRAALRPPLELTGDRLSPAQQQAASQIQRGLHTEGLLLTLARAVQTLGPARFTRDHPAHFTELARLGLPMDLLTFFAPGNLDEANGASVVAEVSQRLAIGQSPNHLEPWLESIPFRFRPSHPGFRAADETGTHALGCLRLQIGGGYRGGLVEGGSFHVIDQLALAAPDVDLLISVPEEYLEVTRWLAEHRWPRPGRVTLVLEPDAIAPWTQDNGKAGVVWGPEDQPVQLAVLTPRYATISEHASMFMPAESFLMDGVQAAGRRVIHSPLLFQGGNLLLVEDPADRNHVLLVGEAEVQRNRRLGLTRSQVLEALRVELGADRSVALPAASYHLDYDLAIRRQGDRLVAFVNDSSAASRLIVHRGMQALEQAGLLAREAGHRARTLLETENRAGLRPFLSALLQPCFTREGRLRETIVRLFATRPEEAAAANVAVFLNAIDLLASENRAAPGNHTDGPDSDYLKALHDLQNATRTQQELLLSFGWDLVPVPSLPDLKRSLNYLNAVHDRTRWFLPVNGGFYSELDNTAMRVFRDTLGPEIEIVPILTQDIQQRHGALHCVISAAPRLDADGR